MATMIPDMTVEEVEREHGSHAEAQVYAAARDQLGTDYTVLYSVAWIEKNRTGGPEEGEADFVILHPDRGILVLEVKGGGVERNPAGAGWITRNAEGIQRIRDPFDQAQDSSHALDRKLEEARINLPAAFTQGHSVAFPDVFRRGALLGPNAPEEIALFSDDLDDFGSRVELLYKFWTPEFPDRGFDVLGNEGVRAVTSVLAPDVRLEMSIGSRIRIDDLRFAEATRPQMSVLRGLNRNRRARVIGAAGTGKTMLAVEKARQLASEGFETLLTCFNRPLIEHLEERCGEINGLTVRTFHDHCVQMARAASIPMPELDGNPPPDFWDNRLPELLFQALDALPGSRFDAVVIDEAQDIEDDWMELFELCLRDSDSAVFYAFEDPSQSIYRDTSEQSPEGILFELPANLRNTRTIHDAALNFYDGAPPDCDGPDGEPVQQISIGSVDVLPAEIGRLLHRLVNEQDVKAEEIVVLSHRSTTNSILSHGQVVGSFELVPVGQADTRKVEFESAWRFKGLERPVVILVEFSPNADRKIRYSAMTRSRSHLVLVGTDDQLSGFDLTV